MEFNPEPALTSVSPLARFDGQDFMVTYLNRNNYSGYARLASTIEFGRLSSLQTVEQPAMKIYPNPARDVLHIQWDNQGFSSGSVTLKVLDMQGRTALSGQFRGSQTSISLADLQKGFYLLQLSDGKQTVSQKLIVE